MDNQTAHYPLIEVTSDWGKFFGIVWHNQGAFGPRGMIGYIDFSSNKAWVLFPCSKFPFARIRLGRFQPEAE